MTTKSKAYKPKYIKSRNLENSKTIYLYYLPCLLSDGGKGGVGGGNKKAGADKQYEAEKSETGKVAWTVYVFYFKSMGVWFATSCLLFFSGM